MLGLIRMGVVAGALFTGVASAASVVVVNPSGYYDYRAANFAASRQGYVNRTMPVSQVVYVVESAPVSLYTYKEYEVVGYVYEHCNACSSSHVVNSRPRKCR